MVRINLPRVGAMSLVIAATSLVSAQQKYDLLLKGGHVIDARNNISAVRDVAIADGKIAAVAANIDAADAAKVVDASGFYVTPGLVDIHVHVYAGTGERGSYAGDNSVYPDGFTLRSGVTTVVDAGSSGWRSFDDFKNRVIDRSKTRVLAFLNIVGAGMRGDTFEQNLSDMEAKPTADMALRHKGVIVGIKTAHYNGPEWTPVERAVDAGTQANIPVMVDFGANRPERPMAELVTKKLRPGDIYTHAYSGLRNELDAAGRVNPGMWDGRRRGVIFDVGHGGGSFAWRVAVPAIKEGFRPDSISTDLHVGSMNAGMKDMLNVMDKFLAMGLPLDDVVRWSTWNPAREIKHDELGHLSPGAPADIAVLRLETGTFGFVDMYGARMPGTRKLTCELTLRDGKVVFDLNGITRPDWSTLPRDYRQTGDARWDAVSPAPVRQPRQPLSFADIARPSSGSWPTYHGSLSGNRFSPLDQINVATIHSLAPKWMFTIQGAPRPLQATPIVIDGVMYVTSVNEAYALDARTGRAIWHYSRPRTPGLAGDAATGINRGAAALGDRVFMVTDNAHLIALSRDKGELLWDVEMADSRQNYGATGAPLAVSVDSCRPATADCDLVIAGVSGGDEGVRGFLDAYRASSGERAWRFWTVPAPGEPGSETWNGRAIEHGCAATWLTGTYDPESRLLYWPTGNPCPDYNGDERKGDNLYSASVLALDPQNGRLRWHYQFTPHDLHDWDANQTPMLVDARFHGQARKLLVQGNRNGFFYVLDRLTGKVLLTEPFVKSLTWASGIGRDGRPLPKDDSEPTREGQRTCPAVAGATNWPSTAYSPATGFFYLFADESCAIYTKNDQWWEAGKSFYGGVTRRAPGGSAAGKALKALDLQTGKTAWEVQVGGSILGSGLMATAGGLVFYGADDGFVAVDAKDGKSIWQFTTNQSWKAGPMTYSVEGTQYIAVAAGVNVLAFSLR